MLISDFFSKITMSIWAHDTVNVSKNINAVDEI